VKTELDALGVVVRVIVFQRVRAAHGARAQPPAPPCAAACAEGESCRNDVSCRASREAAYRG
jgi:hypothetical protein